MESVHLAFGKHIRSLCVSQASDDLKCFLSPVVFLLNLVWVNQILDFKKTKKRKKRRKCCATDSSVTQGT